MTTTAPDTLEAFGATFLRLHAALGNAEEAQWQKSHQPRPQDDTTERASGTVSDPTWTVFNDRNRQRLRAAVIEAEQALESAVRVMQAAELHLSRTHDRLNGDDSE